MSTKKEKEAASHSPQQWNLKMRKWQKDLNILKKF